jgi:hypothetical protein
MLSTEEVQQSLRTLYEIWVVRIDVSVFNFDEVYDHFGGGGEALVEDFFHDVLDLVLKLLVSVYFNQVNFVDDISQLLIHLMGTVKRRIQQSSYLLPNQYFKRLLWHEKRR